MRISPTARISGPRYPVPQNGSFLDTLKPIIALYGRGPCSKTWFRRVYPKWPIFGSFLRPLLEQDPDPFSPNPRGVRWVVKPRTNTRWVSARARTRARARAETNRVFVLESVVQRESLLNHHDKMQDFDRPLKKPKKPCFSCFPSHHLFLTPKHQESPFKYILRTSQEWHLCDHFYVTFCHKNRIFWVRIPQFLTLLNKIEYLT